MTTQTFCRAAGIHLSTLDASTQGVTFLARLPDDRHLQLSEKLYHLIECLDVPRSASELAEAFHRRTGEAISESQVLHLLRHVLIPSRLVQHPLGQDRQPPAAASILALHLRRDLLPAAWLRPVARRLGVLFYPPLTTALLVMAAAVHLIAYRHTGFPPQLFAGSINLPLAYWLFIGSVLIHELGHLAACTRFGCSHGPLGVGLYFLNPVFYVDVTGVWRLPRAQRVIVDAAGVFFHVLCAIPLAALYLLTEDATYLWVIVSIDLAALVNLNPIFKFDGYWILSDLTGIPNLHTRAWGVIGGWVTQAARRLGVRAAPGTPSPFLTQLSPALYRAVMVYALAYVVLLPVSAALFGPLIAQFVLDLPVQLTVSAWGVQSAFIEREYAAALNDLGGMVWLGLMAINLGILVGRPLASLLSRLIWQRTGGRLHPAAAYRFAWVVLGAIVLASLSPSLWALLRPQPGEAVALQPRIHLPPGAPHLPYNSNPPTSGPHAFEPAQPGFYDIAVPDEVLVHNLEHGYVILWYDCSVLDQAQCHSLKARLKTVMAQARPLSVLSGARKLIAVPRSGFGAQIALTSWGRIQKLSAFEEAAVLAFIERRRNLAPEPGAP